MLWWPADSYTMNTSRTLLIEIGSLSAPASTKRRINGDCIRLAAMVKAVSPCLSCWLISARALSKHSTMWMSPWCAATVKTVRPSWSGFFVSAPNSINVVAITMSLRKTAACRGLWFQVNLVLQPAGPAALARASSRRLTMSCWLRSTATIKGDSYAVSPVLQEKGDHFGMPCLTCLEKGRCPILILTVGILKLLQNPAGRGWEKSM